MNPKAANALVEHNTPATAKVVPPPLPADRHTTEDSVLHSCAPPVVNSDTIGVDTPDRLPNAIGSIEIDSSHGAGGKRESAGWLSSLAFHGLILILLGLLLAPADFGGIDTHNLYMTFVHKDEIAQDGAEIEVALFDDETEADEPEPEPEPEPIDPPPAPSLESPIAAANDTGNDSGKSENSNSGATGAATGGSFFGIKAEGHEFVYVLDMSGSMRGRRYRRACAELVRSVSELEETQSFYVVLFSSSTVQMFNQSSFLPTPVPATRKNKEELSRWLGESYRGGGTDPREALRVALRMNPSAVFMLSDGEFNGHKKQKRSSLVGGNSDAFSIVAAASSQSPIHSIAFEDPQSCENMKRLSEMTGGEYRFASFKAAVAAGESLSQARAALKRGEHATAEILLRGTISIYGSTEPGWQARKELAAMRFDKAQQAIKDGKMIVAKTALTEIVELDPNATVTADMQQQLMEALLAHSQSESVGGQEQTAISALAEIVERYPESKTTQQIVGPVANGLLDEALQLAEKGKPAQSLLKLEQVIDKFPLTLAADQCRAKRTQLVEDLLAQANEVRKAEDDAACARYLRALIVKFRGTQLQELATQSLEDLAVEMLTKARDANYERDWVAKAETNRQLEEGFSGDHILSRMRRECSRREVKARDLLRRGNHLERVAGIDAAMRQYKELVNLHSETLAARKAQERIRALGQEASGDMLEMMLEPDESSEMLLETMQ